MKKIIHILRALILIFPIFFPINSMAGICEENLEIGTRESLKLSQQIAQTRQQIESITGINLEPLIEKLLKMESHLIKRLIFASEINSKIPPEVLKIITSQIHLKLRGPIEPYQGPSETFFDFTNGQM